MGVFEFLPYVNFHELNLDWILAKLKEYEQRLGSVEAALDALKDTIGTTVYNVMVEWLNDGTLAGLISGAMLYKEYMIQDINNIPVGVTFQVGDTVTTNTAIYLVANSGISFGIYKLVPLYYTNLSDLGLVADGLTDDSTAFQAAYNLIYDMDMKGGTVLLNNQITLQSNSSIKNGKIKWATNLGTAFDASSIDNFTFDSVEFDVSASTPLGKKISIVDSNNIKLNRVYAHDWYGTFARLNNITNLEVTNSRFVNSSGGTGDVGAALYSNGGTDLYYNNLQSKTLSDNLIYLDGSTAINNVVISNISGEGHTGTENPHVIAIYGETIGADINNVIIKDCDNGIRIAYRNNIMPQNIVVNNVSIRNAKFAGIDIRTDTTPKVASVILNNINIYYSFQDGIQLTNVQAVDIKNSSILACARNGIFLTNATNSTIANCRIENRSDSVGVAFVKLDSDSANNVISNCFLYNRVSGETPTGFQDLRTITSGNNVITLCRIVGTFVLNGYDIRTAYVLIPIDSAHAPKSNSIMFGTASDKPTAGLADGVYLIDSSGASNGWHYYNGAWVQN